MMLAAGSPERPTVQPVGRFSQALLRLLMRQARIVATEWLAGRFKLITLEGSALAGIAWIPGQKIQIAMGSAFTARTYTPLEWNADAGRSCILGFAPGDGPGSAWVRNVEAGDRCDLFGPRGSLDLRRIPQFAVVMGDETSIGLAYALTHADPTRAVTCLFEIGDTESARQVPVQLCIGDATLFAKQDGDAHLEAMEAAIPALAAAGAGFVLTGRAAMVQGLRRRLKLCGVPATHILTKAYWAPGKTGLD
ncbi:siderophore-interacting protein [Sphingomonas koreensis]|uniref:Siderophore-interacting protein n=1 Tax=Sphingomonas koreensis TaxID=93064 RepID=A0A430FXT7_9SPHN|nr:siderophore-interacting protein [Sphingomonas koreensis]RSY76486.1 siderophore-interacting protein [Sphingomonas koreensis]